MGGGVGVGVDGYERVLKLPGCAHGVCSGSGSPSLRSAVCDRQQSVSQLIPNINTDTHSAQVTVKRLTELIIHTDSVPFTPAPSSMVLLHSGGAHVNM